MSSSPLSAVEASSVPTNDPPSMMRESRHGPRAGAGVVLPAMVLLFVLACAVAPSVLAPDSPTAMHVQAILRAPSLSHIMGTDQFGRDIASRVIFGSRSVLVIGFGSVMIGGLVGSAVGITAGSLGGTSDLILMRLIEIVMAFPSLLLALAIVTAFGSGTRTVVAAIAIAATPLFARVMRGETLKISEEHYIEAARLMGAGSARVMLTHVVPNVLPTFLVLATITTGSAILMASTLSFLGLSASWSTPDWGHMLADGRDYMSVAWWVATMPGIAITALVLSINTLGDRVRDILDPRSAQSIGQARRFSILPQRAR